MNIVFFHPQEPLVQAFRAQGHTVVCPPPKSGVYNLHFLLDGASPDLIIQMESLGPRLFISGLENAPCPTLFWAIDSHLNLYWQRWYTLLFDAVLTPHPSLFCPLPSFCKPPDLHRMAWFGARRAWIPHSERAHTISFCGRLSEHRPIRSMLTQLLIPEGLFLQSDIPSDEMMNLYDQSRVVPNESIALETNFRLLEAGSCGCLVLSQNIGEDQNSLLTPGEEFLVYHDGLELLEQARWAKARPHSVEAMGKAAMRRIQAEHLPEHRVRTMLRCAANATQKRLRGNAAALAFWLTLAPRLRNHTLPLGRANYAALGLELLHTAAASSPDAQCRALARAALGQIICLLAESSSPVAKEQALRISAEIARYPTSGPGGTPADAQSIPARLSIFFEEKPPAAWPEIASPAIACSLRDKQLPLARQLRLIAATHFAQAAGEIPGADMPSLALQWAQHMEHRGEIFWAGFGFDPEQGMLPDDALNWLTFAAHACGGLNREMKLCRKRLLAKTPALIYSHMGALADISLNDPDNWRAQLDYGLACLRCLRMQAGLFELAQARDKAQAKGDARAFSLALRKLPAHLQTLLA